MLSIESENHRRFMLEGTYGSIWSNHFSSRNTQIWVLWLMTRKHLKISKEKNPQPLSSLCQCSKTHIAQKCCLVFTLLCSSLCCPGTGQCFICTLPLGIFDKIPLSLLFCKLSSYTCLSLSSQGRCSCPIIILINLHSFCMTRSFLYRKALFPTVINILVLKYMRAVIPTV